MFTSLCLQVYVYKSINEYIFKYKNINILFINAIY